MHMFFFLKADDPLLLCSQKGAVISIDPGLLEGQDQRATCMALLLSVEVT